MYCRNCGKEVQEKAVACIGCGAAPKAGNKFCFNCGAATEPIQIVCIKCGADMRKGAYDGAASGKNKIAAGLLGIFLGALGIHKFYLGYSKEGVIMLLITLVSFIPTFGLGPAAVGLIGFIEGIIYLVKSDEDFAQTYIQNHKGWF
jgi:TM2 domain-containing membrane protein YozV